MSGNLSRKYKRKMVAEAERRFWGDVPPKTECGTLDLTPYNAARGTAYVSGTNYDLGKVKVKRN